MTGRDDGTLEAMYISLSDERVSKAEEIIEDILLADYNDKDEVIGIEILAPVQISRLVRLVEEPKRQPFRRFLKRTAPSELVRS